MRFHRATATPPRYPPLTATGLGPRSFFEFDFRAGRQWLARGFFATESSPVIRLGKDTGGGGGK